MIDIEDLAREAYRAYGDTTDHRNYLRQPMPEWEELGDPIQTAWRAAAMAVAMKVTGQ